MDHERLIRTLASDMADRAALRAVAAQMDSNPMTSSRTEAVLRELARPAPETWPDGRPFTQQDCLDYATSFMEASGIPGDLALLAIDAIADVSIDDVPTEQLEDQGLVDHLDEALRTDPGGLARNPDAEQEYQGALERLNAPRLAPAYTAEQRARDDARIAEIESRYMRAEPGSADWKAYWRNDSPMPGEYRQIQERRLAPPAGPEIGADNAASA
jgi:hypothetical protein